MNDIPITNPAPAHSEPLHAAVIKVLKTCFDPEIRVNIYDLGLIYDVAIDAESNVLVTMTLTSMFCPVAGTLPAEVETKVAALPGVGSAKVNVVWEPHWSREMMSQSAKLQLGLL